ncbi:MAG: hypothetical protein PWQ50_18 [Methanolobus sp.]|nr:hypothetical protein [Methanolobus sp.]
MSSELIDNSEVSEVIENILKLEDNDKNELFSLIGLQIQPDKAENEIKAELAEYISKNESVLHKICLFLRFNEISSNLNNINKSYLKNILPRKSQSSINAKSTKEEICSQIRELFVNEKIIEDEFINKLEIYKTVANFEKIKDKGQLDLLSVKIWPDLNEKMDKKQLSIKLRTDLEYGRLSPEDVNNHIESQKGTSKQSGSKSDNTPELLSEIQSLNAKISLLENEIKKQNERISNFDKLGSQILNHLKMLDNSMDSHFLDLKDNFSIGSTESLLKSSQKKLINNNLKNPSSYDELLRALKMDNMEDVSLLRDGLSIMVLHYMAGITKEIEWEVSLDQFYRVVNEEINKIGKLTSNSIEIQLIFNSVCDRLNINENKFDELLIKCYENELVRLETGSPIFDKNPKLVISGNNKYCYVKLLKMM